MYVTERVLGIALLIIRTVYACVFYVDVASTPVCVGAYVFISVNAWIAGWLSGWLGGWTSGWVAGWVG